MNKPKRDVHRLLTLVVAVDERPEVREGRMRVVLNEEVDRPSLGLMADDPAAL
jgi:hypothetical protein